MESNDEVSNEAGSSFSSRRVTRDIERVAEVREVTMYVATDDSQHRTRDLALRRNKELEKIRAANEALESGWSVHDAAIVAGYDKPPEVLKRITSETPLIISHWQCRDEPGYRVIEFNVCGVYVHGHAGSWTGSYGADVSLSDLARYAERTLAAAQDAARNAG